MSDLEEFELCRCGKRGYGDLGDARRVARRMNGRQAKGRAPVGVYRCTRPDSELWHVGGKRTQGAARAKTS